ncbi:MAG: hypothetical protein H7Y13_11290 [Sphingobacteriaceae bacterium]|nr:hypothetical protein [Sphingobacteriaceae bacterium]
MIAFVQPLFAFNHALRLDVEVKPKNRYLNFIVSPEYYTGYVYDKGFTSASENLRSDKLRGAGIGVSHKIEFNKKNDRPYLSYGFMYRNIKINYEDEGFLPYKQNGLDYYEYNNFSDRLKINSVLLNACIGSQTRTFESFILDVYMGMGYKISSKKSSFPDKREYNQEPLSYAYNGFSFLVGLKAGYKIKK